VKLLAGVTLLVLAAAGAWWALGGGADEGVERALAPGGAAPARRAAGEPAPRLLEARPGDPTTRSGTGGAVAAPDAPQAAAPPAAAPEFAARYAGWTGERMLRESSRQLAQLDLAAKEAARPLLAGAAAQPDVGPLPVTSGILVRENGRRLVLDEVRFADLYRMRAEALWVAQEGGRRLAAEAARKR
jgi:hypothetical protein